MSIQAFLQYQKKMTPQVCEPSNYALLFHRFQRFKLLLSFHQLPKKLYICSYQFVRDVAQSGSVPGWGSGGRKFESCRPDIFKRLLIFQESFFCSIQTVLFKPGNTSVLERIFVLASLRKFKNNL